MKYRAFGDFRKGYAHVKKGSAAEDYAGSYNDPDGRFCIGVICDGHSDKNCFRSDRGAKFGCESAVEILKRFFELYYLQEERTLPEAFEGRLKKSLKLCWDQKVYKDIEQDPIKEEELIPLSEEVRKIYEGENSLLSIYGATFLAIGMCEDFFIALHIGDGVILCIDEDGLYYSPVPSDAKSETGSPASLCDSDLFERENAFRIAVSEKLPRVATVSSDGIEDCMDSLGYKQFIYKLFQEIEKKESENQPADKLNDEQKQYLGNRLEYYAGKGNGAEDDCSFAAIYDLDHPVPYIRISSDEAKRLWEADARERNEIVRDYERRKETLLQKMHQLRVSPAFEDSLRTEQFMEARVRYEEQKRILATMVTNEKDKVSRYEQRMNFYAQYIEDMRKDGISDAKLLQIQDVDEALMKPDQDLAELNSLRQNKLQKAERKELLEDELASAGKVLDAEFEKAKQLVRRDPQNDAEREQIRNTVKGIIEGATEQYWEKSDSFTLAAQEAEEAENAYKERKETYLTGLRSQYAQKDRKQEWERQPGQKEKKQRKKEKASDGWFPLF